MTTPETARSPYRLLVLALANGCTFLGMEAFLPLDLLGMKTIALDGAAGKAYRDKAYEAGWAGIVRQSPQHGEKLKEFFAKGN